MEDKLVPIAIFFLLFQITQNNWYLGISDYRDWRYIIAGI